MKVGKFGIKGADKSAITTERSLQSLHTFGRLTFQFVFYFPSEATSHSTVNITQLRETFYRGEKFYIFVFGELNSDLKLINMQD